MIALTCDSFILQPISISGHFPFFISMEYYKLFDSIKIKTSLQLASIFIWQSLGNVHSSYVEI